MGVLQQKEVKQCCYEQKICTYLTQNKTAKRLVLERKFCERSLNISFMIEDVANECESQYLYCIEWESKGGVTIL